jgi:hypothetical protein
MAQKTKIKKTSQKQKSVARQKTENFKKWQNHGLQNKSKKNNQLILKFNKAKNKQKRF